MIWLQYLSIFIEFQNCSMESKISERSVQTGYVAIGSQHKQQQHKRKNCNHSQRLTYFPFPRHNS